MRAAAPGKIVLTGAYAVLYGAPALVMAVDRHAIADSDRRNTRRSPELAAAFGDAAAPAVDTSALYERGVKLGLGSSAAVTVAALATTVTAAELERGRHALFQRARAAHAQAQGGGSGIDIAASTFGGLLEYRLSSCGEENPASASRGESPVDGEATSRVWPAGLVCEVFFAGQSAKTSGLLARVRALAAADPAMFRRVMDAVITSSTEAVAALGAASDFVAAAARFGRALGALGAAAAAPIVTPAFGELAQLAEREHAAFFGAGAGGGDIAVHLGTEPASRAFTARARELGLTPVALALDPLGVRHLA